ncbi:hypothetical protein HK100_001495 [Physocladia obscura]|uniref:Glucanase n=1 Tax=Physocladia obscura TaxID=109957 RepID=A0AAD5SWP9_9FUNG|nr:hypothetical protein HK100_001495 [Physocladia obscura]
MQFAILAAVMANFATVSAQSLASFPYTLCTSTACEVRNTYVTPAMPYGSLSNVNTSGTSLTMGSNRLYLVNPAQTAYEPIYLKNRKLTFTMDISEIPCGMNAAMYFTAINLSSEIGYGYCDGQNTCNEFDVTEGNIGGQQVTAHPCPLASQSNAQGTCSSWGCGINDMSSTAIGPKYTSGIDLTKAFVVTTTFATSDGTDTGTLSSVVQTFTQGGTVVSIGILTESSCASLPTAQYGGGFSAMSKGLDEGMVFILSLWGTANSGDMDWLDGGSSTAKCSALSGLSQVAKFSAFTVAPISGTVGKTTTTAVEKATTTTTVPNTTTTISKASTTISKAITTISKDTTTISKAITTVPKVTTTTSAPKTITTAQKTTTVATKTISATIATKTTTAVKNTTTAANFCATKWAQCGGIGWIGPTCCTSSTCTIQKMKLALVTVATIILMTMEVAAGGGIGQLTITAPLTDPHRQAEPTPAPA